MLTERFEQLGLYWSVWTEGTGSFLVVMRPDTVTDKGVSTGFTVLLIILNILMALSLLQMKRPYNCRYNYRLMVVGRVTIRSVM